MPQAVTMGAMMQCSFGTAPASLMVVPKPILLEGPIAANIMDNIPIANIPPFGMCTTPSNPMVAAATSAALGVLTPQPCVPVIPAPWVPGSLPVIMGTAPALHQSCKCMCTWGGVIQITNPGTTKTTVA